MDFAIIYEVKRGDLGPDGKLSTQGVRYSDVATARLAAFAAERAAQAAVWDAACWPRTTRATDTPAHDSCTLHTRVY